MIAHISNDRLERKESVAEHTEKTTYLCREKGRRCGISHVMSLCGIFHDLGKNKQAFADYIQADDRTRRKLKGTVAHASAGAKYLYDMYHGLSGNVRFMVEMISYAIAAHHGLFDCVNNENIDLFSKKLQIDEDYGEACDNAGRDYLHEYEVDKIFTNASTEFDMVWKRIRELYTRLTPLLSGRYGQKANKMLSDCKYFMLACMQRLILSILIDSDWEATSDFMAGIDTLSKGRGTDTGEIFGTALRNFDVYMQDKLQAAAASQLTDREREIIDARNVLQDACRQFAGHPAGIYCLPIPTGGGKTLSGLAYALEYCRLHPETERIIYVSPYISITEQNAQVFREAIGNESWILEHHSSVVRRDDNESGESKQEDYRREKLSRYDINWEDPFICTTFVQFMNTLFSDEKVSIRRMHRLVNAVVIIDEVQSMPLKCVHTFNYMINFLHAVCHTNIVLCTATQPTLEEAECPLCYSVPKYMITDRMGWFHRFERVKINTPVRNQKYTLESLGTEIMERTSEYHSILVVLNTKSAVRTLYDILKEKKLRVEYLTTNLCAQHRSDKIRSIKEALEDRQERIIVVSTNLIEAGVDLSFACVYRSMAGLDSLAQTAGRCNRNGELAQGVIHLITLEGEHTGNMVDLQRGIGAAESVIFQYEKSEKKDSLLTPVWMDEYYRRIYESAADSMNFPVTDLDTNIVELLSEGFEPQEKKNYMNQAYQTAGKAYRIIDDRSFGVIVPYKDGERIIESIRNTSDMAEIKTYIRQAQRYTVNLRENQWKKYNGLIEPVSDQIAGLYMVAAPGAYHPDCGITPEWETLII